MIIYESIEDLEQMIKELESARDSARYLKNKLTWVNSITAADIAHFEIFETVVNDRINAIKLTLVVERLLSEDP